MSMSRAGSGKFAKSRLSRAISPAIALGVLLISGSALADSYQMVVPVSGLSVADRVESAPAGSSAMDYGYGHCYALVEGALQA